VAEQLEPASWAAPDANAAVPHPFDADTSVERSGDTSFTATISDRWNVNSGNPNGGYLLALCARALAVTVDEPDPLALSAHYLRPATPGDAQITVDIARTGQRLATAEARLVQHGDEVVRVTGTFGDLQQRTGATLISGRPLRLPSPDSCVDPMTAGPIPGVTIADQVDYRYPEMPGWRVGRPSGDPRGAFWMRFHEPRTPDLLGLACLVDAGAAAVMELGAGGSATIQLSAYMHAVAATEWVASRVRTRYVVGGYHDEDVELWDATGSLVAQARQLAILR
jgi:acyl-CoA thioesterase